MAKFRVTENGVSVVVEAAEGTSREELKRLARAKAVKPTPTATPPAGPDVVGRAHAALTAEPPLGSRTGLSRALFGEKIGGWDTPGRVVRAAGDLVLPSSVPEAAALGATLPIGGSVVTAPLKRAGAAALAGGGAALAQGRDWASSLMEGGKQGLSQAAGELLPGMLRFGSTQKAGQRAIAAHETAKTAQATAHETATAAAKSGFEAAKRAYAEEGAKTIAESFKQQVPAWRDFPSNEQGLLGMVYGSGQAKLSAIYDEVMKEIIIGARGRSVEILAKDASELKIRMWNVRGAKERGMPDMAMVDASQLAEKATGFWKKNPGVYRRAVATLDKLDIGDPEARAAYKAGQALIQFTDKTKMLKGEKFNPEAARAGFTDLKKVDELRRRGQGDIFTGPVAEAVRRPAPELKLPAEPKPLPESPEGVTSKTLPKMGFWSGAAIAEIPFLVKGLVEGGGHFGYGLPVAVGGLVSSALSGRNVITKAPLSKATRAATDLTPPLLSQEARRLSSGSPITVTPKDVPSGEAAMADINRQMKERFGAAK